MSTSVRILIHPLSPRDTRLWSVLAGVQFGFTTGAAAALIGRLPPGVLGPERSKLSSTFATVRHRTKVTKGPGSRGAGLAMAFKLIEAAELRWRAVNAPQLVALVRVGATFHHGKLVERSDGDTDEQAVA